MEHRHRGRASVERPCVSLAHGNRLLSTQLSAASWCQPVSFSHAQCRIGSVAVSLIPLDSTPETSSAACVSLKPHRPHASLQTVVMCTSGLGY